MPRQKRSNSGEIKSRKDDKKPKKSLSDLDTLKKEKFIDIEDETQSPKQLLIHFDKLIELKDVSEYTVNKQLDRLSKDGIILLRGNNDNKNIALNIRNNIIKHLKSFNFIDEIIPNKLDNNEYNGYNELKSINNKLNAIYFGSVGEREDPNRVFWYYLKNKNCNNNDSSDDSINPESQHTYHNKSNNSGNINKLNRKNKKSVFKKFDKLTAKQKGKIVNTIKYDSSTLALERTIKDIFGKYCDKNNMNCDCEIIEPCWFRIQNHRTLLHTDFSYISVHTSLLHGESGHKLLLSGIDIQNKGKIRNNSKELKKKKFDTTSKCPCCKPINEDSDIDSDKDKDIKS